MAKAENTNGRETVIMEYVTWPSVVISILFASILVGCAPVPHEGTSAQFEYLEPVGTETVSSLTVPNTYHHTSSDDVHSLRSAEPELTLVLEWKQRLELLDGERSDEIYSGTLRLGPDYFMVETDGEAVIADFALRRMYGYTSKESTYINDSMFAPVQFYHMEAINRAVQGEMFKVLQPGHDIAGYQQFWFEAELSVPARNLPPVMFDTRNPDENTISFQWSNETVAVFQFSETRLNQPYSAVLERALRYRFNIHPAVVSTVLPLRRIPAKIMSLHSYEIDKKARSIVTFSLIREETAPFPLPKSLEAKIFRGDDSKEVRRISELGTKAIEGKWGSGEPSLEDYAADAAAADASGDRLGTWLAWTAASLHYPGKIKACDTKSPSNFCSLYRNQMDTALMDEGPKALTRASMACANDNGELGIQELMTVDVDKQKHGYVATMILGCLLYGLPTSAYEAVENQGTISLGPLGNAILALEGNPYIPSFYAEIGTWYLQQYETFIAWRLFDIGRTLGGGVTGDAFQQLVTPYEANLLELYPAFF